MRVPLFALGLVAASKAPSPRLCLLPLHRIVSESAFPPIFHLQYIHTYPCAAGILLPPLNPSYSRDAADPPAFLGHHEYI